MKLDKLLEQTREKYRNEKDPMKRRVLLSLGRSIKSRMESKEYQLEEAVKEEIC